MSGMDIITERILKEAGEAADRCRKQARQEAEKIRKEGQKKEEEIAETIRKRLEEERSRQCRQNREGCERQRKLQLLTARQEILREMEAAVRKTLDQWEDGQYFAAMEKLLEAEVRPRDGVLCLAETDLTRMPEGFPERAEEIARKKGGTLTIRGQKNRTADGFVLLYGNMEINCTWEALAGERRDQMKDAAARLLWGELYE